MPPPTQRVAKPNVAFLLIISKSKVIKIRAPLAPIGWPMAIAPPLTLTFSRSQPMSRFTVTAWAAKASLASIRSRSLTVSPAFSRAFWEAGIGPVPMIAGIHPGRGIGADIGHRF